MFGDNIPHDDNLYEGISGSTWSTGGDPGRDEVQMTVDDLNLQTVLGEMSSNDVTLLYIDSGGYSSFWDYWTGLTGGASYDLRAHQVAPAIRFIFHKNNFE